MPTYPAPALTRDSCMWYVPCNELLMNTCVVYRMFRICNRTVHLDIEVHFVSSSLGCLFLQVKFYAANGFYVVLDNQFNLDTTAKDNPGQWLSWWQQLLNDVITDPESKNRVMLDLLNEPDSQYYG